MRSDDVLISGRTRQEHLENVETVLEVLCRNGARLKRSKCSFMVPEVIYLGFKINCDGVSPVDEKKTPIIQAPPPTTVTQLKSFLGMVNYYHRHLPNIAHILEPLHVLLRKGNKWDWGERQQKSFMEVKEALCSAELLVHDPEKPVVLHTDASPYGIGAVLSHILPDQSERPIAYHSKVLSPAERNYAQIEREGLAIVDAVKKFHQYLYGRKFYIVTDHQPLLGLLSESKPITMMSAARIQRWAVFLSGYEYILKYRPGDKNGNADCMSRLPTNGNDNQPDFMNYAPIMMMELSDSSINADLVKSHKRRDPILSNQVYIYRVSQNKVSPFEQV